MCYKILKICQACLIIFFYLIDPDCAQEVYNVTNYKFHYPYGSGMGMYVAIALPVDIPDRDVFFAYFYEAFYGLPFNETSYEYPPLIERRSYGRNTVYTAIENKLNAAGYPGKTCLLRTICEGAMSSLPYFNGILGDLLYILLTPSSSKNDGNLTDYEEAEKYGNKKQDCSNYHSCSISLLDLISFNKG